MTRALIVGAGMGGLTAALALARHGIEVEVHEQSRELREVGAGLTLGRSAVKGLDSLGLLDAIRNASQVSAGIPFVHYRTGERLWGPAATPTGPPAGTSIAEDPAEDRFVSRHIYRADLQEILVSALARRAPGALRLGRRFVGWSADSAGVVARFADGADAAGDLLIGADGLNSVVRATHGSADPPVFTGQVAWRFLVDGARAQPFLSSGPAAVFFGPDRIVNRYLLREGSLLNCVAIVRTPGWQEENWSTPGDPDELAALFADWHADVRGIVALADPRRLFKWALGIHPPLSTWIVGRTVLLGDAAHPMLPFLGMGAAMAIEDAIVLGRAMGSGVGVAAALAVYEAARKDRATALAHASARQGELLQAQDPDRFDGLVTPLADRSLFDYDPTTAPLAP